MNDDNSDPIGGSSSNLPRSSLILIISISSISGALLVCLLAYVLHRMRKGHALVDILKLRQPGHSRQIYQDEHRPIHYEQRYSVRSSRYPLSLLRGNKSLPTLPPPVTQSGVPMSSAKPPSMIMEPHMAYLKGSDKHLNPSPIKMYRNSGVPTISVQSVGDEPTSPISSNHPNTRWSWTNSEAPSTPRLNIEKRRTSNGSFFPLQKPVAQSDHMDAIDEDSVPPIPCGKAQEILETGGAGYLPPREPKSKNKSKSKKAMGWKSALW